MPMRTTLIGSHHVLGIQSLVWIMFWLLHLMTPARHMSIAMRCPSTPLSAHQPPSLRRGGVWIGPDVLGLRRRGDLNPARFSSWETGHAGVIFDASFHVPRSRGSRLGLHSSLFQLSGHVLARYQLALTVQLGRKPCLF